MTLTNKQKQILDFYQVKQLSDFLFVYPFRYEEIIQTDESLMMINDQVVIEGQIISPIQKHFYQGRKSVARFRFLSPYNEYSVSIFNRPWLKSPSDGTQCTLLGKLQKPNTILATNLYFKPLSEVGGIVPIYPLRKDVNQRSMRSIMKKVMALHLKSKKQLFLEGVLEEVGYPHFNDALHEIHFPSDSTSLKAAIQTIKYAEFFMYHLKILVTSHLTQAVYKPTKVFDQTLIDDFIKSLPYELSVDQVQSVDEILADLKSNQVMMRLLQGDVGSGKTIVAIISALAMISAGYQVAFLAPTEILATQHYINIKKILSAFKIRTAFLSASLKTSEKHQINDALVNHEIDLLIGTHAIFQDQINFAKLGLVITDEQHRFGVMQRRALINKGEAVDVLSMSATPIPRTLANALFSELSISSIMSMPLNRAPIKTHLIYENSLRSIIDDLFEQMDQKHQIYVICPAITKGQLNTRNVVEVYENLKAAYGDIYRIAMLHGQMDASLKESIMQRFVSGEIDMLISTTVIEVGIDVGNATRLVVYDADRFGLSQLHQLRGRIGRSHLESVCYLLSKSTDPDSLARLILLEKYDNGFEIAYHDLVSRGPGDIVGIKQSGLPSFSFGNVIDDQKLLMDAKEHVLRFLKSDLNENQVAMIEKLKNDMLVENTVAD